MAARAQYPRVALLAATLVSAQFGCAPPQAPAAPKPVPRVVFAFVAPDSCRLPASASVTFAVVQPGWSQAAAAALLGAGVGTQGLPAYPSAGYMPPAPAIYEEMRTAMRNDFFSALTCKGFTTKGPFATYDEMVYPDRIGTDLVLAPEIDLSMAMSSLEPISNTTQDMINATLSRGNQLPARKYRGQATLVGRVSLNVPESISNTRMWSRSIPISQESFAFVTEQEYTAQTPNLYLMQMVRADPGFVRALGPKLQAIYQTSLAAAWKYLDVREMDVVRKQSLVPRKKALIMSPR